MPQTPFMRLPRPAVMFRLGRWLLGGLLLWGWTAAVLAQEPPALAGLLTPALLDLAQCQNWHNGSPQTRDDARLRHALGLPAPPEAAHREWSAGRSDGQTPGGDKFQYRLAFTAALTMGSLLANASEVSFLRAEAPYPGDPAVAAHWQTLAMPPGQGTRLLTLTQPITTRAVLLTDQRRGGQSAPGPVRFFAPRLVNLAPLAGARANAEYQAPNNFGGVSRRAIGVARGQGIWENTGKADKGVIAAPPVSELHPAWLVLAWDSPQELLGLYLSDNFATVHYEIYTGPPGISPLAGVANEWTRLKAAQIKVTERQGRWVSFATPQRSTGLRLLITQVSAEREQSPAVARLSRLQVFSDLGEQPAPAVANEPPAPPLAIPYEAPRDGFLTLVVNDAQGRRVRNLLAREERPAGPNSVPWDLADEAGRLVPPGQYRWQLITAPPLTLHYEQTVYPNVTANHPDNSPWLNGHDGPGGWLADHSPPRSVAVGGDFVFFGAPVAESGVSFAACDLSGKKLWGIHSFANWSGGQSLASDGQSVFVQHPGAGHYGAADEGADRVWAVDIATQKWRPLLVAQNTETRRRGIAGMAARAGQVALAINAADNWLENACGWAVVHPELCLPLYPPVRKPRFPYEIVPDPRSDFLRLFRLKGVPPGYGHPNGEGLIWLESTRGPERRQHLLLAFTQPVAIGSCVLPVPQGEPWKVRLSVLKATAPWPPRVTAAGDWQDFEQQASASWDIAVAPPNTSTRALLVSFTKGAGDDLDDLLDPDAGDPKALPGDAELAPKKTAIPGFGDGAAWTGRLEGLRILRRRFANVAGSAKVRVNSGAVDRHGVWVAKRDTPLSRQDPAVMVLEWPTAQALRGLAIKEIDGERSEMDVWTGPAGTPVTLTDGEHWRQVAALTSKRRMDHSGFAGHNAQARYLDEVVDFGDEYSTRAVRLRVVSQFATHTREGSTAKDGLGLDPTRCRIFGVAALRVLGGEPPVPATVAQRVELVDGQSGELLSEVAIKRPSHLAYAPDGTLYAVADGQVVKVALTGGAHQPLITSLAQPGPLACDRQGNLFVFDGAPDQRVVRVYDPTGQPMRVIGEPGGYQAGPWNPRRFQQLTALAVDREDKLWCVDGSYWPKRISCWRTNGEFLRDFLGNTQYGGGGVLDPWDRTRLFYGPLEFELDWERGTSRLKNLTWLGTLPGERPIRIAERTYLVTRPTFTRQPCAVIYLYERDRLKAAAAIGAADAFPPLREPALAQALGAQVLTELQFIWADRDGDGLVQYAECEFSPRTIGALSDFDEKLSIQAGAQAYEVREYLPSGVPVYTLKSYPLPAGQRYGDAALYRLGNGHFYRFGGSELVPDAGFAADGQMLWQYPNEGAGVGPDRHAPPYSPGQVICQFALIGGGQPRRGDLGEFFVVNTNFGVWNLWTADGLMAGRLFRDLRDGQRRAWSMREHERGLRLDDVTAGQEHFQGWFGQQRDHDKFYAVAGHNHASVVEVRGLEEFRRASGEFTVSEADLAAAQEWRKELLKFRAREEAKVIECYDITGTVGGKEWARLPVARLEADPLQPRRAISFQLCHDERTLYARWELRGAGPFKNAGSQWDRLFKTGAAVDLMIGLDAQADPRRRAPVAGDQRILVAMHQKRPTAVLYDAVVPGTPADARWTVVSPVARVEFDVVRRLTEAHHAKLHHPAQVTVEPIMTVGGGGVEATQIGQIIELALPFKVLGWAPTPGARIRFDWGVLETDDSGDTVLARHYWSNKTTSTLADAPSEARLEPDLWGWAIFPGRSSQTPALGLPTKLLNTEKGDELDLELDEP